MKNVYTPDIFKKGIKLRRTFILGKLKNWTAIKNEYDLLQFQEFSVDVFGRCFKGTLEAIHKRIKYKFKWS